MSFSDRPAQREGVLGADGLHMNARGHELVAAELLGQLAAAGRKGGPGGNGRPSRRGAGAT